MPRANDGTVTLPGGNPVAAGTVATAAVENATMTDIAAMLEDSLSRTGKGGMAIPMLFPDGTSSAPGIGFTNEPTSGLYRAAGLKLGMTVGTIIRMFWDSALNIVTSLGDFAIASDAGGFGGNLTVQHNATVSGTATLATAAIGTATVSGTLGVTGTPTFTAQIMANGGMDCNDQKIWNMAEPVFDQDAATKLYVDGKVGGTGAGVAIALTDTGLYSSTSLVYNMINEVTLTTTGRPIRVVLVPAAAKIGEMSHTGTAFAGSGYTFKLDRNSVTNLGEMTYSTATFNVTTPIYPISWIDMAPPVGSTTYGLFGKSTVGSATLRVYNMTLVAFEL